MKFDSEAKKRGLTFLNECGLDPGIDHIATMRLKEKIESEGKRLVEYYSYCGALFSPECLEGNPFGYKFSWSPLGVLKALKNSSQFLMEGKIKSIPQRNVLHSVKGFPGIETLNLYVYPNRDSVPYKEIYGFENCTSLMRGTIRYKGFCEILAAFNDLGLLNSEDTGLRFLNWVDLIQHLVGQWSPEASSGSEKMKIEESQPLVEEILKEFGFRNMVSNLDFSKLFRIVTSHRTWRALSKSEFKNKLRTVIKGFNYLDLFSESSKIPTNLSSKPIIEILCHQMKLKMSAEKGDQDLVIMVHYFVIEGKTGFSEMVKSSMVVTGEKGGLSAVSKTVGYTVAIAASKVLEGVIKTKGVIGPFIPEVYNSVGDELERIGLFCREYRIHAMPKL